MVMWKPQPINPKTPSIGSRNDPIPRMPEFIRGTERDSRFARSLTSDSGPQAAFKNIFAVKAKAASEAQTDMRILKGEFNDIVLDVSRMTDRLKILNNEKLSIREKQVSIIENQIKVVEEMLNKDANKNFAPDRITLSGDCTILVIVKRSPSGFSADEVARESAKAGQSLKQMEIKKGVSVKYGLYYELPNIEFQELESRAELVGLGIEKVSQLLTSERPRVDQLKLEFDFAAKRYESNRKFLPMTEGPMGRYPDPAAA